MDNQPRQPDAITQTGSESGLNNPPGTFIPGVPAGAGNGSDQTHASPQKGEAVSPHGSSGLNQSGPGNW